MPEDKDRRRKRIEDNFERNLPRIWERAREKNEELKAKFIEENSIGGKSTITFCVFCHSNEVLNQFTEISIPNKGERFRSVKLVAKKCDSCGEEYINEREIRAIEIIIKVIDEVFDKNEKKLGNTEKQEKVDELKKAVLGKQEYERQKELYKIRMLKSDYNVGLLNIIECVFCNCSDVRNKLLELDVGVEGILSVDVQGAECTQCGKQYLFGNDLKIVETFKQLIKSNNH
ncbi:hypothetical protein KB559_20590 [Paenibacillus sp. Marseille-P2973]|uniref:hypothetical protein n=1 Tax=Paenibacillus sp. Marseille-P2973 TaxID=1871032 RepID=UPI001B37487A|nr:hypothetical protein [Paenibacillus sp. Marseille-P2973]MBQ4901245.1 hypothetical protein [Paenibacillus sp. Marseille-P2973]